MISRPLVKYVLTAAARDRLVVTLVLMTALGAAMAVFLGSASITEQDSFALVFGANGLRFLSVGGLVLFCTFYMRRAFDTKEVEFLLARPVSRLTFLFSHAAAFILLAVAAAVVTALVVMMLGAPDGGGLAAWAFSLAVENAIMATAALFFSMVLSSAAGSALATFGFYVLARLIGGLLGIAAMTPENIVFAFLNNVMKIISVAIPRLDLMAQTGWLVYGVEGAGAGLAIREHAGPLAGAMLENIGLYGFLGLQGVLFILLLFAAAAFDFTRREF